jgi:hypothetical protein
MKDDKIKQAMSALRNSKKKWSEAVFWIIYIFGYK